jgi:hypothetical protein
MRLKRAPTLLSQNLTLKNVCLAQVRKKAEANPGLVPYEFVLPVRNKRDTLAIVGSWSDYKERHRMRKQDDLCRVTLLLPPGKFDFQVYRNGQLASQKRHTLRSDRFARSSAFPSPGGGLLI